MRGFTSGLGTASCAVCLATVKHDGSMLVARRHRYEYVFRGSPAHSAEHVEVGIDYAHAGCALEALNSGWVIE